MRFLIYNGTKKTIDWNLISPFHNACSFFENNSYMSLFLCEGIISSLPKEQPCALNWLIVHGDSEKGGHAVEAVAFATGHRADQHLGCWVAGVSSSRSILGWSCITRDQGPPPISPTAAQGGPLPSRENKGSCCLVPKGDVLAGWFLVLSLIVRGPF